MFQQLNSKKAAGPDNISPCLLKSVPTSSQVSSQAYSVCLLANVKPPLLQNVNYHPCSQEIYSLLLKRSWAYCLDLYSHEDNRALCPHVSEINYRSIT